MVYLLKEKVKVPNVIMYSVEDAVILLESQGLRENINYESTFDYDMNCFSISPLLG